MQLVRYEQARQALAECHKVDEVKDIRDKAEAMRQELKEAQQRGVSMASTYARLLLQTVTVQDVFSEQEIELFMQVESAIRQRIAEVTLSSA